MKQRSKYGMPPPTTRVDLEHNVFLLVDEIERNIDDASYIRNRLWALGDSLERLRHLPNRRIELPTIDEKIRNYSNMLDWIEDLPPVTFKKKESKE